MQTASALHPKSIVVPSLLLALAPLLDIVRLLTRDPTWARAAFWSALLAALVVAIGVIPELVDWLATDPHTRARDAGAAPLTMHVAAVAPLALGVFERAHLAAATRAAAAGLPSLTRLDAWPMALAIAGALAWIIGCWMSEEREPRLRSRYQPTGLPFNA